MLTLTTVILSLLTQGALPTAALPASSSNLTWYANVGLLILLSALNVLQYRKGQEIKAAQAEMRTAQEKAQQAENEVSHWKGTATAYEKELVVVRDRCERIESESKGQAAVIAELRARTDVTKVQEQNLRIIEELNKLAAVINERHVKQVELLSQSMTTIDSLSRHVTQHFEAHDTVLGRIASTLEAIEGRLTLQLSMPGVGPSSTLASKG